MAVITVTVGDNSPIPLQWELPGGPQQLRSPIPAGLVTFSGITAIALKEAGNQTSYVLTLTMPKGFAYLPRYMVMRYASDTLVAEWNLRGLGKYNRTSRGSISAGDVGATYFQLLSPGANEQLALFKNFIWTADVGTPKLMLQENDTMVIYLEDMDAGETPAGDMNYWIEFYVYQVDQIDKWEINTPIPVTSHSAF